ncbi:hypothetical protein [Streptosporangium sp. NPDC023615]|uniref:hypothetical protein n=1 Tax=Streptosporangium sp. NPDC023615 TaxID=3154794 RepID=UPI003447F6DD
MPPKRVRPISNTALAAAIEAAGWTRTQTARHINAVATENGVPLHYDHSTVGHWLTGTTPRPEGICAGTEAFRRGLRRPDLVPGDLGWPEVAGLAEAADDPWQGDVVARLTALGEDDMLRRRTVLTAGAFSLAGLAAPPASSARVSARRGGAGDAARIRDTARRFGDLDDLYGGGHARHAVAAYLVHDVAPLLQGTAGRARPNLFRAAAELTYLAAYMAMDAGANGLALRYHVQTVRLADEAGDRVLRATSLRSMAVQARELGHDREALVLADAAASALGGRAPGRTVAWVTGMQAEAHAGVANRQDALTLLRRTEAQLERVDSSPEVEWTGNYRRESLAHQTGLALTALGDHVAAAEHYAASTGSRRPVERRTRALVGLRCARAYLRAGDAERAAVAVLSLREYLEGVVSARVRGELRVLRQGWVRCRADAHVAQADVLAAGLLR